MTAEGTRVVEALRLRASIQPDDLRCMANLSGDAATQPADAASGLYGRLAALTRRYGILDVYVFGSRAAEVAARVRGERGSPGGPAGSDVDIGVRPRRGTPFGVDARVALTLDLEDLLDVGRVDLVVLPEAGAFLALAAVSGELLFCDDPTDQAEYELYVLRRAGDLLPFERERRELILRHGAR